MKNRIITALLVSAIFTPVQAQSSLDRILTEIEQNNKSILAARAYADAKKVEYKIGLTPDDPTIVYDLLYGSPVEVGNQRELTISQPLDFPTAYITTRKRSKEQGALSDYEFGVLRQSVLLEAKQTLLEWVYRTKLDSLLKDLTSDRKALVTFIQKSIDEGEGNRLDLNKARLKLLDDEAAYTKNTSILRQLELKIKEMNGGVPLSLTGVWYEPRITLPDLETVLERYRTSDLTLNYLKKEREIIDLEVSLAKSLALPKIELGYLDHSVLNERFKGLHLGVSIPVWENKHTIKSKKAELIYRDARVNANENEQSSELIRQYERLSVLDNTLNAYNKELSTTNHRDLLKKSLELGNSSIINYLLELDSYYEAMQRYLELERTYHHALAEWMKFKL